MVHARNLFVVLFGIAAIGILIVVVLAYWGVLKEPRDTVTALSALISTLALSSSLLAFVVNTDRDRHSNALEISRRWDSEPLLSARLTLRPLYGETEALAAKLAGDSPESVQIKGAIIHMANFFWDMAIAIDIKMATPDFLKQRFSVGLKRLSPSFAALRATNPKDEAIAIAISSINQLCTSWGINPISETPKGK